MTLYEKDIHLYPDGTSKIVLRLVEYGNREFLDIRKFYKDFEENWLPTKEGLRFEATLYNVANLFDSLVDLLSNEEAISIIKKFRTELLKRSNNQSAGSL